MAILNLKDLEDIKQNDIIINNKKINIDKKFISSKDLKKIMDKEEAWEWLVRKGIINGKPMHNILEHKINNIWIGEACYIIGSGPPLKSFIDEYGWKFFDDKNTIGINHIVEDYDNLDILFFLDKRFLDKTIYNLNNFKGMIFAQSNTGMEQKNNVILYHCNPTKLGKNLNDGLFSPNFSGIATLNLALLSGADPIYLIGYGMGSIGNENNFHYKKNYTGSVHNEKIYNKYKNVQKGFNKFYHEKNRIIHITDGNDINVFKKIGIKDFKNHIKKRITIDVNRNPKIVHISFDKNISVHADITRIIINNCFGNHILVGKNDFIPDADLYILEHFLSTDVFIHNFKLKNKAIDIVHTINCIPPSGIKSVVVLTEAWKKHLENYFINNINVMNIGIDLDEYNNILPDYNNKIFGRITRWSPGKIHPRWTEIVLEILEEIKDSKCLIYSKLDQAGQRIPLIHDRMIYDSSCNIDMFKGDFLKKMSIYVHANGSFIDTFSHAVLEAMATGLPIILLDDKIGAVKEVIGDAGIICNNIDDVKVRIKNMLGDKDMRIEYGFKSKERAKFFSKEKMINKFNRILNECLKE